MDSQPPIIQNVNRFLRKKKLFLKAIQKQLFFVGYPREVLDGFDKNC